MSTETTRVLAPVARVTTADSLIRIGVETVTRL